MGEGVFSIGATILMDFFLMFIMLVFMSVMCIVGRRSIIFSLRKLMII